MGRKLHTGKFETRKELEQRVMELAAQHKTYNVIGRMCGVSEAVACSIWNQRMKAGAARQAKIHKEEKTMSTVKNAVITAATITNDEHGCLSAWLTLDYGDCGMQGFGGYNLYIPRKNSVSKGNYAGHFIWRVMEVADVTSWDKLVNKCIRVESNATNIIRIGHITKAIWFEPKSEFEKLHE